MWLGSTDKTLLTELLEQSWKSLASKKQVKEFEERKTRESK